MKKIVGFFALIAVSSMATSAIASGVDGDDKPINYAQGQLGFFGLGEDLDDNNYDSGFNGSLAYGRYITPNIIVEGMLDYFVVESDINGSNHVQGRYSRDNTLSATGLLLTVKGEYPMGSVDIFGGVGVGVYGVILDTEIDSDRIGDTSDDEFDATFGAHLSVGANYNINKNVYVGIEGRYRWTGEIDIDEIVASVPQEYEGNLNGYSIAVTAGVRF